jgi:hypothetical protein
MPEISMSHIEAQCRRDRPHQPMARRTSSVASVWCRHKSANPSQLGRSGLRCQQSIFQVGMFARISIDAKRSYGVAVPHTAIDRLTAARRRTAAPSNAQGPRRAVVSKPPPKSLKGSTSANRRGRCWHIASERRPDQDRSLMKLISAGTL